MRILFVSRRMLVNLSLLGVVVCLVGVLKLLGGSLSIAWDPATGHMMMTGPATEVFTGEIIL